MTQDANKPASNEETMLLERLAVLGQMFAEVVHDVNNLIGAATAHAEAELLRQTERESVENLTCLLKSLRLAGQAATRVVEFARPSGGVGTIDDTVRAVLEMFSYSSNRGVQLGWVCAPGLPAVAMPTAHLQLILANLVKNALDAVCDQPAPTIRIRADQSGDRVVLNVWNPGPEIPEELLSRVFEPFFTTKPPGKGTGLGLAIARRLAAGSGATLNADNAPGGVVFTLSIPVSTQEAAPAARELPSAPPAALNGHRILIIDDDKATRQSLALLLRLANRVTVETCDNGREALEMLSRERFDAIILDLRMPGISGQEVYDRLPENFKRQVVFLSGDTVQTSPDGFPHSTGQPALFKPVALPQLVGALCQVSGRA